MNSEARLLSGCSLWLWGLGIGWYGVPTNGTLAGRVAELYRRCRWLTGLRLCAVRCVGATAYASHRSGGLYKGLHKVE